MDPIDQARRRLQRQVRQTLSGTNAPPTWADAEDDGLFGEDSATWIVHADSAMLVGGIRALFYQLLHPRAMAGVADHSDYEHDPLGRLHRTAGFLGTTTFGPSAEATQAIAAVRAIHDRVVGTTPDGEPYEANDPRLLAWVHATEVDSFLLAFQTYGQVRLAPDEADQYVAEMGTIAEGLGLADPPRSTAELDALLTDFRPEMAAGQQAKEALRFLLAPPLPLPAKGPYAVLTGAALGLLPTDARKMLGLPRAPLVGELVVKPAATALVKVIGWALTAPDDDPESTQSERAPT